MKRRTFLIVMFLVAVAINLPIELMDGIQDSTGMVGEIAASTGRAFIPWALASIPLWRKPSSLTPFGISVAIFLVVSWLMFLGATG